ncbi:hypothetical protein [Pseudoalteromonas sp. MMG005]|uniref:hypothetical protein n=1 Tax=Pseudoalteromonas sp. MMG005 TaxID=2822682 RepID=UPI001B3A0949|nr:hypothetical protein [Pseudoalteromonas sp. MMG005]
MLVEVAGLSRSVFYYKHKRPLDDEVIDALLALVERHQRWGLPKLFKRLRNKGKPRNKKRDERVYNMLKLNLRPWRGKPKQIRVDNGLPI